MTTPAEMPVLEARDIGKKFLPGGGQGLLRAVLGLRAPVAKYVLRQVNLTLRAGDVMGIIGVNGSGKSTLLKIIAGTMLPTEGSRTVRGSIASLIELGAGFHPDLPGIENLALFGALHRIPKRQMDEIIPAIVDFAELGDAIRDPVRTYSSGMQMRLGFSAAVCLNPALLIVDEALAVGDSRFQLKCLARIDHYRESGGTLLIVSHDLDVIRNRCGQVLWLHEGAMKAVGPARAVIEQYLAFLRSLPAGDIKGLGSSLYAVHDRLGDQRLRIHGQRLEDSAGAERQVFRVGEAVTVRFNIEARIEPEDPQLVVKIRRADRLIMASAETWAENLAAPLTTGVNEVRVTFPSLPLAPGDYYLILGVAPHNYFDSPYDLWMNTCPFRIEGDRLEQGVMALPHTWSFRNAPPR